MIIYCNKSYVPPISDRQILGYIVKYVYVMDLVSLSLILKLDFVFLGKLNCLPPHPHPSTKIENKKKNSFQNQGQFPKSRVYL